VDLFFLEDFLHPVDDAIGEQFSEEHHIGFVSQLFEWFSEGIVTNEDNRSVESVVAEGFVSKLTVLLVFGFGELEMDLGLCFRVFGKWGKVFSGGGEGMGVLIFGFLFFAILEEIEDFGDAVGFAFHHSVDFV
jgi:hypothetical protein